MGSRYRPPQRIGAFGGAEGQLRARGNSRCGAARRAAAARSVLYPPARWRGSSVRPLPARYRREKRKKTKENERKSRTGRVSSPYSCPAPPRPLVARRPRPGPVHLGPTLAGLWGPIRPRQSDARSPDGSRARRLRGARAGGRGRASAEIYAGALAGQRGSGKHGGRRVRVHRMATARPDAAYSAEGHLRGRTCSLRTMCGRGPAERAGWGSLPTYTCLALGGAAAAAAALSGVPDPRARGLSPVGRVPGRRGALRGSGLPERSLNTLLFLARRPESGRGPALPPPPSNGEAAPGPSSP